eukprot:651546-Pleurochrysis_carterae.AAC.1
MMKAKVKASAEMMAAAMASAVMEAEMCVKRPHVRSVCMHAARCMRVRCVRMHAMRACAVTAHGYAMRARA